MGHFRDEPTQGVSTIRQAEAKGHTAPAYLVHADDAATLHSALEQLLSRFDDPSTVFNKFAGYTAERVMKARPYEAIWGWAGGWHQRKEIGRTEWVSYEGV